MIKTSKGKSPGERVNSLFPHFESITIFCRELPKNEWEHVDIIGPNPLVHQELIEYANNPKNQRKQIMAVFVGLGNKGNSCLYSRLSSDKDLTWADLRNFFCSTPDCATHGDGK